MPSMDELVARIRQEHEWTPPVADADAQIADFAARSGYLLPSDMQVFFRLCGSASLFEGHFDILPPGNWLLISEALYGKGNEDDGCPDSWYAFCDAGDGDHVGIILATHDDTPAQNILDCNHEDLTPANIIASSFTEFLTRTLDAGDEKYWLADDFRPYGTATYEISAAYWRRADAGFWESLGPERCTTPDCIHLRITHSTQCRRHHYEMLYRQPCPFDEDA